MSEGDARVPLLAARSVGLSFGGVVALADVSLTIDAGSIHAVIGPNGAGKTSLLNVLSGYYTPDSGTVNLAGLPVTRRPPYTIARLGMARTFQTAQLFRDLTVRENVAVGLAGQHTGSLFAALIGLARRRDRRLMRDADSLLTALGLDRIADIPSDSLPAGLRRRVEIARALARRPRLLMLDEPAAGLTPVEIEELDRELSALRDRGGPSVILVEHHMDLVMAVSDRISVLNHGRVIASGSAESVRENPAVVEAYLGGSKGTSIGSAPSAPAHERSTRASALGVSGLSVAYGAAVVLREISLEVREGEIISVIGANGAGKTTLLKTVAGVLRPSGGRISLDGTDIGGHFSYHVARRGIILVPEGRGIFGDQSVRDNLLLGALARRDGRDPTAVAADMERTFHHFPVLQDRLDDMAGSLSGGQQQMLAVARGLMARPRFLLLDEPSLGLAPQLVTDIFAVLGRLRDEGVTILLVEQMAAQALQLADRAYVLERGRITLEGPAAAIAQNPAVVQAYLGASAKKDPRQ